MTSFMEFMLMVIEGFFTFHFSFRDLLAKGLRQKRHVDEKTQMITEVNVKTSEVNCK